MRDFLLGTSGVLQVYMGRGGNGMRLRILFAAMLAIGVALVPTSADAKGAMEVTVTGPGLEAAIRITNSADVSANRIAQRSGLFRGPSAGALAGRPAGDLGPRYVATYAWLIGQDETTPLREELYPFADGGAVTHTPPGQKVGESSAPGGWYRAGPELTLLLVNVGVPVPPSYTLPVPVVAPPQVTG
jgi:hypothetical protein